MIAPGVRGLLVRRADAFLAASVLGYFALTILPLSPVNPFSRTRFEITPGGSVRIPGPSLFLSRPAPSPLLAEPFRDGHFEFELSVRTDRDDVRGPGRILSLTTGPESQNWMLGQREGALVVRHRGREAEFGGALLPGGLRELRVQLEGDRVTLLHPDGRRETRDLQGRAGPWSPRCRLALGNEPTGDRPWTGEIAHLTIRAGDRPEHSFSLEAAGARLRLAGATGVAVELPPVSWPWKHKLQRSLGSQPPPQLHDVIGNVLIAVPIGLFLRIRTGRGVRPARAFLVVLVVQASLTLIAESIQLFSMFRYPDPTDLATNLVGAAAGALLGGAALSERVE